MSNPIAAPVRIAAASTAAAIAATTSEFRVKPPLPDGLHCTGALSLVLVHRARWWSVSAQHRISAGAIVVRENKVLMVRHRRPEVYDFWVCPGGGVQGTETLEAAAEREVKEETGLDITALRLAYVEEFFNPETRYVKFWFTGALVGGTLDTTHPETVREHIIEAAWRAEEEIKQGLVFPEFMQGRFWDDMERGFPSIVRVPLRKMTVW